MRIKELKEKYLLELTKSQLQKPIELDQVCKD